MMLTTSSLFLMSEGILINCTYTVRFFWLHSNLYTCDGIFEFVGEQRLRMVTEVSQNHLVNQTDSDVRGFVVTSQHLGLIPRHIAQFFPNLLALELNELGLWQISREDFEAFNQLQSLSLRDNHIQIVDSNLFDGNLRLQSIDLNNNPLRHVSHNVFSRLIALTTLHMTGATMCHSESVNMNRTEVEALTTRIAVNCMMTFEMTEDRILNGDMFNEKTIRHIKQQLDPQTIYLMKQIQRLEDRIVQLERNAQQTSD